MTNTKGNRRGICYIFFRPFRKHGVVPLATYMWIYKKCDIVDIKGMSTFQKGMPHKCFRGKTGSLQCHPAHVWHCYKQRTRFWPRKLVYILSKLSTLRARIASWNVWRKNGRKPKRKVPGFNWSASLFHPEKHTLWELQEPIPHEFMAL